MVEHNIVLNVKQGGPVDTGIEVTQGDYGKVKLLIRVKDNEEYIKNPVKASLFFKLSNGMVIQGAPRINVGTYEYIFQGSELQSPGKVAAVITLEYNEGRVSSCGFTFNCRAHPLFGKGFEAGPYIADLEKIVQQAQEQVDYLNELIEMMHEALNETVLTRADLVNNGETTQAGFKALDAAMGKTIMDQITQLNGNLNNLNAGGFFAVKHYSNVHVNALDQFPLPGEYGKSYIRMFNTIFDGMIIENSSASGNYAAQLYIASNALKFRKRQESKVYEDWVVLAGS